MIVASNYVQLRLGSLLADHYLKTSEGGRWAAVAELISNGQPRDLIGKCKKLKLLMAKEEGQLNKLFELRNNAAHRVILWRDEKQVRKPRPQFAKEARSACESAKSFLARTGFPE